MPTVKISGNTPWVPKREWDVAAEEITRLEREVKHLTAERDALRVPLTIVRAAKQIALDSGLFNTAARLRDLERHLLEPPKGGDGDDE